MFVVVVVVASFSQDGIVKCRLNTADFPDEQNRSVFLNCTPKEQTFFSPKAFIKFTNTWQNKPHLHDKRSHASCDPRLPIGWCHHAMSGAERSLVRVLLSFTPLRMATSMFSSSPPSPPPPPCWCCWVSWLARGTVGGLVEAWPLQDATGIIPTSSCPGNVGGAELNSPPPTSSAVLTPFRAADTSGTVGGFTGTTGVRMGMGPAPTEPERRAEGLDEGVRRIVATPGVTMIGPWPGGKRRKALW